MDYDYQRELISKAYELSLKQSQKNLIQREGLKFRDEDEYKKEIEDRSSKMSKETVDLLQILDKISDGGKAELAIVLDKLSYGEMMKKTDIEIKINSKKVSIKDYIEEVLPHADFESANEKATEYLKANRN